MKLSKCEHGHFYDADKYPGCPYCNAELQKGGSAIVAPAAQPSAPAPAAPEGPVTGWLVVLEGPARGRDLRLGEGRSFLGVDGGGAPIVLNADAPLGVRQAVVAYDPEQNAFTLLPGSAQQLAYRNGKAALTPQPLTGGDTLCLGAAGAPRMVFVPFCGADFCWGRPDGDAPKRPAARKPRAKRSTVRAASAAQEAPPASEPPAPAGDAQ